jgi:hypothetical protein
MGSIKLSRDAAFEPEALKAMTDAYDSVLTKINGQGTPAVRELVAKRIVELAAAGECNPKRLRNKVLLRIAV